MRLLNTILFPPRGVVRDPRGISVREFSSTSFREPVVSGKNKCGTYTKYIDTNLHTIMRFLSEISYFALDSKGKNLGIQIKTLFLTQILRDCKHFQGKFLFYLLWRSRSPLKYHLALLGIKSNKNNMLSGITAQNSPDLTILGVSITISTFQKREQKRSRVHIGLCRRLRCFGNAEGWSNVRAIKFGNQRLSGKCHAYANETTRSNSAFLGC
ncbi:hypothetical protein GGQ65_006534 [Rhizobium fabae]|uniref:Uncharacterized protein n=1 Tax=Rhizobium fabae TaxID=573179 RepID=A0A7W6FMI5_9HYPH|nr:hypothetical protein [Rhizobium fabae]